MLLTIKTAATSTPNIVSMRCPSCGQLGSFEPLPANSTYLDHYADDGAQQLYTGERRCPNPECSTQVFVVIDAQNNVIASYPPQRIDFDATDLPSGVRAALEEAITCHAAGAYRGAAMMVRRTLEELCADRGAEGKDLKKRLEGLRDRIVLPKALLDGMDRLRLLGNDAGHIEARIYDEIGSGELETAITVAKEVLKAVYQYDALVARLGALTESSEANTSPES